MASTSNADIQRLIAERNYYELSRLTPKKSLSPEGLYSIAKANLTLGNINEYENTKNFISGETDLDWLLNLVESFSVIEKKSKRATVISNLVINKEKYTATPYFCGEYYFILGLLFGQLEQYKFSSDFFERSYHFFKKNNFKVDMWFAKFNLFLLLRKLGFKDAAHKHEEFIFNSVDSFASQTRPRLLWLLSGVCHTDLNTSMAIDFLRKAICLHKSHDNITGLSECYIDLNYFLFKENQNLEFGQFNNFNQDRISKTLQSLKTLLETKSDRLNIDFLKKWKHQKLDPLFIHRLIDVFLSKVERAKPPTEVLLYINYIEEHLISRSMYIPFYELNIFKIRSFINANKLSRALIELESKNEIYNLPIFKMQKEHLIEEISKKSKAKNKKINFVLDKDEHILIYGSKYINLERLTTIEKALLALSKKPFKQSADDFFYLVYSEPYSPAFHESRLRSLIWRIQHLIPETKILTSKNNEVSLISKVSLKLKGTSLKETEENRLANIISFIKSSPTMVSAQQIAKRINTPLRTIQEDLKSLSTERAIAKVKKGQKYLYYTSFP